MTATYRAIQSPAPGRLELVERRITALGPQVPAMWRVGQRGGVGCLGGHCNACEQCRQGRFNLCADQPIVGVHCDGGYAEMMQVRATALVRIPDELDALHAAPILCETGTGEVPHGAGHGRQRRSGRRHPALITFVRSRAAMVYPSVPTRSFK